MEDVGLGATEEQGFQPGLPAEELGSVEEGADISFTLEDLLPA